VKKIKIIILALVTIVFILYGMGFMLYTGIGNTLLDQQYYRSVVSNYGLAEMVHEKLQEMIPPIVLEGLTGGSPVTDPKEKAAVDTQVALISTAITDALDDAWIEDQAVMVTDDVVNLLNGEKSSLSAVIELKGRLEEIEQNIALGLENLSDAELFAMFGAPRAYIPMIAEKIVDTLELPESLVIGTMVEEMAPGTLDRVGGYLGTLDALFGILVWVVILVFLVLCILFWRVGRGLQWFGVSTALTGGIFLGLLNYLSNLSNLEGLTGTASSSLPLDSSIIQSIIGFTFSEMKFMPILFIVGGVMLLFLGVVIHKAYNKVARAS